MLAPDPHSVELASPQNLVLAGAGALSLVLLAASFRRRHGGIVRAIALSLRLVALAALGLALATPSVTAQTTRVFKPQGTWELDCSADLAPVYHLSARVRDALAEGVPPEKIVIRGPQQSVRRAAALLEPLGVPCRLEPQDAQPQDVPVLVSIEAPSLLAPGEPLRPSTTSAGGETGLLRLLVDGREAARGVPGQVEWPQLDLGSGRHVLSAELVNERGEVIQRVGHVLRVEPLPRLSAIGFTDDEFSRLAALAPAYDRRAVKTRDLDKPLLQETELVVLPLRAAGELSDAQARALAQFAANGGGVFVTGDGADRVSPEYLPTEFRDLLPVRLLEQPRDKPPDNPIKPQDEKVEVAAVSIAYVIDRSTSMESKVKGVSRWQIAVEAVRKSMEKLDPWDRAGVMAFTLKQSWMPRPKAVAPFNREVIAQELRDLPLDDNYDSRGYNTDIYQAIEAAIDVMDKEPSAVKMIVLLTDGGDRDDDNGKVRNHRALAERAIGKRINIVTLGIGGSFSGDSIDSANCRKVIYDLATKPDFAYVASDDSTAAEAPVVFVKAVTLAYEAYDDEMKQRELDKRARAIAQPKEPPRVDVVKGVYPLRWTPEGLQLLAQSPQPAPRLARFARNIVREDGAEAIALEGVADEQPALLAVRGYALGRSAFWASGLGDEDLGEVAAWKDFPRFFAQTLRWLQPRDEPDPRLVGAASPGGIGLLDPIDGAQYALRLDDRDLPLRLDGGELRGVGGELPEGAGEIIERVGTQERSIGDVFITPRPEAESRAIITDPPAQAAASSDREPVVTTTRREAFEPLLALLCVFLGLMPIERFVRRRS